jgi:myosin heavy subunit
MGLTLNGVIAAGIAGTVTLGAMVTWGGTDALQSAKTKITQQAEAMGIYKSNETKLIEKAKSLKTQIAQLNETIADLQSAGGDNQAMIEDLTNQLANKQIELDKLTEDLAKAQTNGENLAQRIDDLTAELDKANAEADALQVTVNTTNAPISDQAAVDEAIDGTVVTDPATNPTVEPIGTNPDGSAAKQIWMLTDVPYSMTSDGSIKLNVLTDDTVVIINTTDYDRKVTVLGVTTTVPAQSINGVAIGTMSELNNHNLTLANQYGSTMGVYYLMAK